jgi:hypothetical protein
MSMRNCRRIATACMLSYGLFITSEAGASVIYTSRTSTVTAADSTQSSTDLNPFSASLSENIVDPFGNIISVVHALCVRQFVWPGLPGPRSGSKFRAVFCTGSTPGVRNVVGFGTRHACSADQPQREQVRSDSYTTNQGKPRKFPVALAIDRRYYNITRPGCY